MRGRKRGKAECAKWVAAGRISKVDGTKPVVSKSYAPKRERALKPKGLSFKVYVLV